MLEEGGSSFTLKSGKRKGDRGKKVGFMVRGREGDWLFFFFSSLAMRGQRESILGKRGKVSNAKATGGVRMLTGAPAK